MDPRYLLNRRYKFPRKLKIFAATVLALTALSLSPQAAEAQARSNSVVIQLVGVVPAVLQMNFTSTVGNTFDLVGGANGFQIAQGRTQDLGYMNVKSNLLQGYTITAYSENGGTMKSYNNKVEVPYQLVIEDRVIESHNGVFQASFMGKAPREGDMKEVALKFASVSDAATKEVLVDRLTFSISANQK